MSKCKYLGDNGICEKMSDNTVVQPCVEGLCEHDAAASELKSCPFCGLRLEHMANSYKNRNGNEVTEDYFQHPLNDCILSTIPSEGFMVGNCVKDIIDWNTRTAPRFTAEEREAIKELKKCAGIVRRELMPSGHYCNTNNKREWARKIDSAIATVRKMLAESEGEK